MYAPLLRWYVDHGAVITAVYRTIDYTPGKVFDWFAEQVTEARLTGDVEKSKALLAEVFKLVREAHRSFGAANERAGKPKASDHNQTGVPDRNRCLPALKASNP